MGEILLQCQMLSMCGAVLRDQVTFLDAPFESGRTHGAFQEMKPSHVHAFHFLKCLAVFFHSCDTQRVFNNHCKK
jgi:hypothetical protein